MLYRFGITYKSQYFPVHNANNNNDTINNNNHKNNNNSSNGQTDRNHDHRPKKSPQYSFASDGGHLLLRL